MMMSLGQFVFSLPTVAYQESQRKTEWKHPSNSRVGTRDARQFTGVGDDDFTLSGWIAPELTGDPLSLDQLRDMANTGESYVLVEGTGRIYGEFVITNIDEVGSVLCADGLARRIDFTINLKRVDNGNQIGNSSQRTNKLMSEGL